MMVAGQRRLKDTEGTSKIRGLSEDKIGVVPKYDVVNNIERVTERMPCGDCGKKETALQQVGIAGLKIKSKSPKTIAVVTVIVVMAVIIAVAAMQGQKKKEAQEAVERNEELQNLYSYFAFSLKLGGIEENQETVNSLMKNCEICRRNTRRHMSLSKNFMMRISF